MPIKNNIGPDDHGYAYSIEPLEIGGGIQTSRVRWESEPVRMSADALLAQVEAAGDHSALGEAKAFLTELLAGGPVPTLQVFAAAREAGHADKTIRRAKDALGVVARKEPGSLDGGWSWTLPTNLVSDDEHGQVVRQALHSRSNRGMSHRRCRCNERA